MLRWADRCSRQCKSTPPPSFRSLRSMWVGSSSPKTSYSSSSDQLWSASKPKTTSLRQLRPDSSPSSSFWPEGDLWPRLSSFLQVFRRVPSWSLFSSFLWWRPALHHHRSSQQWNPVSPPTFSDDQNLRFLCYLEPHLVFSLTSSVPRPLGPGLRSEPSPAPPPPQSAAVWSPLFSVLCDFVVRCPWRPKGISI